MQLFRRQLRAVESFFGEFKPRPLWESRRRLATVFAFVVVLHGMGRVENTGWAQQPPLIQESAEDSTDKQEASHKHTNSLIKSTSPYLLQHAHNPVNWMEWGPEAFAKAEKEGKPIFVSIGYSTCYWCHVMERESFENEEVAKVLNDNYVAIKVDREQRPDIDEQLMIATEMLTGRGGWPNSVWLTSDGRPWMAGTYFPKDQFKAGLEKLSGIWREDRDAVDKQANLFVEAIQESSQVQAGDQFEVGALVPIDRAVAEYEQLFDAEHGGFSEKPKFPPHGGLRLLAYAAKANSNAQAREMMLRTLDAMWAGGIHDHVGGGFHRYSTDEKWLLPHFEKMLYDNAQLLRSYSEAYELTEDPLYRIAARDILSWLQAEMTAPAGGFYSAVDSESDGEEGYFYTWTIDEVNSALEPEAAKLFSAQYNLSIDGNFAEEATGEKTGRNVPHVQFVEREELRSLSENEERNSMLGKLNSVRLLREHPAIDDKVIAAWNGLMISSLAVAGRAFDDPEFTNAAKQAAEFLKSELYGDGQLFRNWRDGRAELPGYLNDYAFAAEAMLELYKTTGEQQWLETSESLADAMLEEFADRENGGFFFTGDRHEALIARTKNLRSGGNLPVGNGVAVLVLLGLNELKPNPESLAFCEKTLKLFRALMQRAPRQVEHLVLADALFRAAESDRGSEGATKRDAARASYEGVSVLLSSSDSEVSAGESLELIVQIDVDSNFHLYALQSDATVELKPLSVRAKLPAGFEAGETVMPVTTVIQDPILNVDLQTYAGTLLIKIPVSVNNAVQLGKCKLLVEVEFQACDDQRCLQPVMVTLEIEMNVDASKNGNPTEAK